VSKSTSTSAAAVKGEEPLRLSPVPL
jgi:hypothetical protein